MRGCGRRAVNAVSCVWRIAKFKGSSGMRSWPASDVARTTRTQMRLTVRTERTSHAICHLEPSLLHQIPFELISDQEHRRRFAVPQARRAAGDRRSLDKSPRCNSSRRSGVSTRRGGARTAVRAFRGPRGGQVSDTGEIVARFVTSESKRARPARDVEGGSTAPDQRV